MPSKYIDIIANATFDDLLVGLCRRRDIDVNPGHTPLGRQRIIITKKPERVKQPDGRRKRRSYDISLVDESRLKSR